MSTNTVPKPSPKMAVVDHGVEAGITWVTCSAPLYGAVNGYVQIPDGHPWFGLDYDAIEVTVNGGLTYGGDNGWIGFDCLHSGDNWPGAPEYWGRGSHVKNWTPELVADETRSLARQVAAEVSA